MTLYRSVPNSKGPKYSRGPSTCILRHLDLMKPKSGSICAVFARTLQPNALDESKTRNAPLSRYYETSFCGVDRHLPARLICNPRHMLCCNGLFGKGLEYLVYSSEIWESSGDAHSNAYVNASDWFGSDQRLEGWAEVVSAMIRFVPVIISK